jgi:1-aminocyclopropane-1-carboxylate deaminase
MQIQVPSIIQSIQLKSLLGFELEIDVKRDDLIHPHISGNKWRKLQGYLTQENLYKTWVSFGGAYSNHILALSALGKLQQIRTIGIIRGEELNTNSNSMLQQAHANGMELRFVSRELYKDKLRYFKDHFDTESHLFINEGGLGKEVLPGLHGMLEELTKAYDLIFLPFGTGATAYGLGYLLQDSPTQVKAVSVIKDASQELQFSLWRICKVE